MSKRHTDTGKWDKAWFRLLSPKMKCAWLYLLDRCDLAGIWEIDIDAMSFLIGHGIEIDEIYKAFNHRVEPLEDDKIWLPKFVNFHCGNELKESVHYHKKVIARLNQFNLLNRVLYTVPTTVLTTVNNNNRDNNKDRNRNKDRNKGEYEGEIEIEKKIDFVLQKFNEIVGSRFRKTTPMYRHKIGMCLVSSDYDTQKLIDVIEFKNAEWIGTQMAKHLNPDTIFDDSKFPKYDDQVRNYKAGGAGPKANQSSGTKYGKLLDAVESGRFGGKESG